MVILPAKKGDVTTVARWLGQELCFINSGQPWVIKSQFEELFSKKFHVLLDQMIRISPESNEFYWIWIWMNWWISPQNESWRTCPQPHTATHDFFRQNMKHWDHKRWWFIERKPNIGLSFCQFLWQHWISEAEHVQKASLIGTWTLSATSSQGFCWWNCGHGYPSGNQTWPWNWDIPYKRRWFFSE